MTKAEQARLVTWRSKILQHASGEQRTVAHTCRHFGISRKTYYKWKRRQVADGDAGLCDRPRAPQRSPHATPPEVVSKIVYLRRQYHFGAGRIADYLRRFHQVSVARSTVHRLLGKHGFANGQHIGIAHEASEGLLGYNAAKGHRTWVMVLFLIPNEPVINERHIDGGHDDLEL